MHIIFRNMGKIVVDDMGDFGNIKPSGSNIRGHQDPECTGAKTLYRALALPLVTVAMQTGDRMTGLGKIFGQAIGPPFGTGKDQNRTGPGIDLLQKHVILLFRSGLNDGLVYFINRLRYRTDRNRNRIAEEFGRHLPDALGKGCRKENGLAGRRQIGAYPGQLGCETHIEHTVRFIQHQETHLRKGCRSLLQVIQKPPRCGHQNPRTSLQGVDLRRHGCASDQ